MRWIAWFLLVLALAACHRGSSPYSPVVERVQAGPLDFSVLADGELRSARATALVVPGPQWTARQLSWVLPDGSTVKKGELIARFSARQSRQDLKQAQIDLERNVLAHAGKQAELDDKRGKLGVDLTQVAGQLAIARRYAHAGPEAMARNDILDAVQDANYLDVRQHILSWRETQSSLRGKAELAVLDAQHDNFATVAQQKQADLDALELHAPHAGVLVLERSWSGELPHVGSSLYAGLSLGSLPDLSALEVELAVPQIEAQGIQVGDAVELHPWGVPSQGFTGRLTWVAATAQPRGRDNPVKYLSMKASVPADVAHRFGWKPGQRFEGRIILLHLDHGLSVPNVALGGDGDDATVQVLQDGRPQPRRLTLGVRGPTRTQVLAGLGAGDRILLDAAAAGGSSKAGVAP